MIVPEMVYISVYGARSGWGAFCRTRVHDDDIPYRRERECVWKPWTEDSSFLSGCDGSASADEVDDWTYCPYCGGTIKVEES